MTILHQYRAEARQEFAQNRIAIAMAKDRSPVAPVPVKSKHSLSKRHPILAAEVKNAGFAIGLMGGGMVLPFVTDISGLIMPISILLGLHILKTGRFRYARIAAGNPYVMYATAGQSLENINNILGKMVSNFGTQDAADAKAIASLQKMLPSGEPAVVNSLSRSVNEDTITTLCANLKAARRITLHEAWTAEFEYFGQVFPKQRAWETTWDAAMRADQKASSKRRYERAVERHKAVCRLDDAVRARLVLQQSERQPLI